MDKVKNFEKKACLIIGLFGLILPLLTHYSCWSFGFICGIGLAGWKLLPERINNMLDFILKDGKRMTLDYCEDDDYLNAKLWTENGEYMGEIDWDIDTVADMLFTK